MDYLQANKIFITLAVIYEHFVFFVVIFNVVVFLLLFFLYFLGRGNWADDIGFDLNAEFNSNSYLNK